MEVPAAAVIPPVQALFFFTGRKGQLGGRLNWRRNAGRLKLRRFSNDFSARIKRTFGVL